MLNLKNRAKLNIITPVFTKQLKYNNVQTFQLYNRRYLGNKYKLLEFIEKVIKDNCNNFNSFCDIFAGTGIIASFATKKYKKVIINDFLFSNNVIYKAFFGKGEYNNKKLEIFANKVNIAENIEPNYASENFGGKFFSQNDALKIGYARELLEEVNYNKKEYNILLASLLYSADRSANTVGHFDAYIKGKPISDSFVFKLIEPINSNANIEIYQKDSNELAREIKADVVYIDPPYNSRQYSRFYHILENITKWEKQKLHGVALKPKLENMSEYSRATAPQAFADLIQNLNCKYMVVSYNNTYNSKSNSSKNKIELDFIIDTLKKRGELKQFEKAHAFFNAGKTKFADHKEFIFIVKVDE